MSPILTYLRGLAALPPAATLPNGVPGTVGYWLQRLSAALDVQEAESLHYMRYYDGEHPMKFATSKFNETFGTLFSAFSDNWCQVVVDASVERLRVVGFRFGSEEDGERAYEGDHDAWAIWQANYLDADSRLAHLEACKVGQAYLIVDGGDPPRITVESPTEVIVAHAPGDRRQRAAALKRWLDHDGYLHCTVYLPEGSYRFVSHAKFEPGSGNPPRYVPAEQEYVANPFTPVIPVLALRNNPSMLRGGVSDLSTALPIQDAIDKLCTDLLVASEYGAFRQRWATGVVAPIDPSTGEKMTDPSRFLSWVGSVWASERPEAKFGDFNVTDLTNYVKAIEMEIQHLAAQTRTPPHYLTAGLGQWPSGSSLKAAESGLVAKVKAKQETFEEAWEEAMRLAFRALGDPRGQNMDAEVVWADPEFRTEGERVDALVKMRTLGVPLQALWERWGASPQEIARWRDMQAHEAEVLGPAAGPTSPGAALNMKPSPGSEP